jgi:hypothetical protein
MITIDMEMHDRLDLLGVSLRDIHPPVVKTPTPSSATPRPPRLPPAPPDATLTVLARTHVPAPPGPWTLTAQQRQHILDTFRDLDAVAWLPTGGYRRGGRLRRPRRRTR